MHTFLQKSISFVLHISALHGDKTLQKSDIRVQVCVCLSALRTGKTLTALHSSRKK